MDRQVRWEGEVRLPEVELLILNNNSYSKFIRIIIAFLNLSNGVWNDGNSRKEGRELEIEAH